MLGTLNTTGLCNGMSFTCQQAISNINVVIFFNQDSWNLLEDWNEIWPELEYTVRIWACWTFRPSSHKLRNIWLLHWLRAVLLFPSANEAMLKHEPIRRMNQQSWRHTHTKIQQTPVKVLHVMPISILWIKWCLEVWENFHVQYLGNLVGNCYKFVITFEIPRKGIQVFSWITKSNVTPLEYLIHLS